MATMDMGLKEGRGAVLLSRSAGNPSNTLWRFADVYFRTKCRLHPSSRLAAIDMGRKLGGYGTPFGERVGSPSNTKWTEAYLYTKWHLDAFSCFAAIEMGRTLRRGASPPFLGGGWLPM